MATTANVVVQIMNVVTIKIVATTIYNSDFLRLSKRIVEAKKVITSEYA